MPVAVACSHCQVRLKLADKLIGKKVKCPKCEQVFTAQASDSSAAPLQTATVPAKKVTMAKGAPPIASTKPRPRAEDEDDEPRPRSKKRRDDEEEDNRPSRSSRKRKKATSNHLLLALSAGGGVLVVGIIIIFVVVSMNRSPAAGNPPVIARGNAPVKVPIVANPVADPPPKAPEQAVIPPANAPDPAIANQPVGETAQPMVPSPSPAPPMPTPTPELPANTLKPGSKITVRSEIQAVPPGYVGDYNKEVKQNLEIALRNLGFQPVPEGGLILQVSAQISNTGKKISVRTIGLAPPRPKGKADQSSQPNQTQIYPIEQITATMVLTDAQGSALWKNDGRFSSNITTFRTQNPPLEMQQQMWIAFNTWTQGAAIQKMRQ